MPKVKLPTTTRGWAATIVASLVGFFAGITTLSLIGKVTK